MIVVNKIKVQNMRGNNGREVPNQFIIDAVEGQYFQSYDSLVAFRPYKAGSPIVLDNGTWDYSVTTGKYRNIFLDEKKPETEKKIKAGIYKLMDLN